MAEMVKVKYVGPHMAILAGRAIFQGESREVSLGQLEAARRHHPHGFVIVGGEEKPQAVEESEPEISASPAAVKLAEEHGIDLVTVEGSGAGGSIVKSDVEAAVAALVEGEGSGEEEPAE